MKGYLPFIIHPRTGKVCSTDALPDLWPESGFLGTTTEVPWPVPWLKGARLADCRCGDTGVQCQSYEDMARYLPGAKLEEEDGRVVMKLDVLGSIPRDDGSGKDEEAVSDEMVDAALEQFHGSGLPHVALPAQQFVSPHSRDYERIKQEASYQSAVDEADRKNRDFVRRIIQAALEKLPDAHRH